MNFFKRSILLIIVFILTITSTGCWNRRELNSIGIVETMGMDLTDDNKIKLTLELVDASSLKQGATKGGTVSQSYIQITGDTVFDAFRNATLKYDRKLFLPHIRLYIFGEKLAKKGLVNYIDWHQRDHEPRRSVDIMIVKGGTAESVVGIKGGIEASTAGYVEKIFDLSKANGKSTPVKLVDLLKTYYAQGIQPVIGVLTITDKIDVKNKDITYMGTKKALSVEGCAICKDGKLIGYLDDLETRGLNFVNNKIKSSLIPIQIHDGNKDTSIEILKSNSKNSVKIKDDSIEIKIEVKIKGMLGEEQKSIDLRKTDSIKKIENLCSKEIEKEIKKAVSKCQSEYEADIFGFGNIVHQKYPKEWKNIKNNWDKIFSKAKIDVSVETIIERTGLVNVPASMKEMK